MIVGGIRGREMLMPFVPFSPPVGSGIDAGTCEALLRDLAGFAPALLLMARTPQPRAGEHILASPLRLAIYEAVKAKPGLTLGELRARVDLGWGNGYHHLRKLEQAGLIRTHRVGRRFFILPVGVEEREETAQARGLLRGATARIVCDDIAAHPGAGVADIAARTGHTTRVVYYHVQQLIGHGLVRSSSGTRQFALRVTALYAEATRTTLVQTEGPAEIGPSDL